MADRLEYGIRHRRGFASGGITPTERLSADFIVNRQSLVEMPDRAKNFASDQTLSLPAFEFADENYRAVIRAGSSLRALSPEP